jgi:hypothetical protein
VSKNDLYNIPNSYAVITKTESSDGYNFNDTIRNESMGNFNLLEDMSDYFTLDKKESKKLNSEVKNHFTKKRSKSPKNMNIDDDNLFDKVLNQISYKNKNNRKVTLDSRASMNSNKLTHSSVSSLNSHQNYKVDKISIEIKGTKDISFDKTKGAELFEFDSFSELLKNDHTQNIIENQSHLEDSEYIDINNKIKYEFDQLKEIPISDKLIFGESKMIEKPRCSTFNRKSVDYVFTLGNFNEFKNEYTFLI